MSARPLTQDSIPLVCRDCGHRWTAPLYLPAPVKRAVAAMRGIAANGCPACRATGPSVLLAIDPPASSPSS